MRDYRKIEKRKNIEGFPRYQVSNYGRVYNRYTGRRMALSPTNFGILTVGLMRDDGDGYVRQYRRSVKRLVAEAFVPGQTEMFDTPIQLDGDRTNMRSDNLMWRPRWFAWLYIHQFEDPQDWFYSGPIFDITNRIEYENILHAAITNGSLCKDIRFSLLGQSLGVWPTGEEYRYNPT
jgi:NUMOD4 motif